VHAFFYDENAPFPGVAQAMMAGETGSRAIAFHLVLSTVSGGSVISAYLHTHRGDFASFEANIPKLLAQGLAAPMCRKLFSALRVNGRPPSL
jgi:hypothetical protein